MNYRYIVVEGSIGSGKNALSRRLAEHFSALSLAENPEHNPFLMKFYANASHHGLATELFFLMRRAESVDIIKNEYAQGGMVVCPDDWRTPSIPEKWSSPEVTRLIS